MLFKFKEHLLGNSIDVFNIYKRITGGSLERDLKEIERRTKILDDPKSTDEEIDRAYDMKEPTEVILMVYASMRLDADPSASLDEVIKEVEVDDLRDGTFEQAISNLVSAGKKNGMRGFLAKRKTA